MDGLLKKNKKGSPDQQLSWDGETSDLSINGDGNTVKLQDFATLDDEFVNFGTTTSSGKITSVANLAQNAAAFGDSSGLTKCIIDSEGRLVVGSGLISLGDHSKTIAEFYDPSSGQRMRVGNNLRAITGKTVGIGMQLSRVTDDSYDNGNGIFSADQDLNIVGRKYIDLFSGRNTIVGERAARFDVDNISASGSGGSRFAFGYNTDTYFRDMFLVSNENEQTTTPGWSQWISHFAQYRVPTGAGGGVNEVNGALRADSNVVQTHTSGHVVNVGGFFAAKNGNAFANDLAIVVPEDSGYVQLGVSPYDLNTGAVEPTSMLDIGNSPSPANQLRIRDTFTPANTGDASGNPGNITWDDNYLYVKVSTGWGRIALDTAF